MIQKKPNDVYVLFTAELNQKVKNKKLCLKGKTSFVDSDLF